LSVPTIPPPSPRHLRPVRLPDPLQAKKRSPDGLRQKPKDDGKADIFAFSSSASHLRSEVLSRSKRKSAKRGKTAAHGAAVFNATRSEVLSRSNFPIILNLFHILLDNSQIKCYPYMRYENNK